MLIPGLYPGCGTLPLPCGGPTCSIRSLAPSVESFAPALMPSPPAEQDMVDWWWPFQFLIWVLVASVPPKGITGTIPKWVPKKPQFRCVGDSVIWRTSQPTSWCFLLQRLRKISQWQVSWVLPPVRELHPPLPWFFCFMGSRGCFIGTCPPS